MEALLRNSFTAHYGLPVCTEPNLVLATNDSYFEIEDTAAREIVLHTIPGHGMARFSNATTLNATVANYDKFVTSLPHGFQLGRKRCDIIVTTDADRYFIIGEIKDSPNISNHRKKAKKQLVESLTTLLAVPQILALVNSKVVKRCIYFNKQPTAPATITAVTAFNRLPTLFTDGFKMSHPGIESLNFEFWEYLGEQTVILSR